MKRRYVALLGVTAVMVGCLPDYPSSSHGSMRYDSPKGPSYEGSASPPTPTADPAGSLGPAPDFGTTVIQADAPPPLSGGNLAVAPDGFTVVAADPDRDRVYVLDYRDGTTLRTIALALHDEPGRVAIDASNRAHVALRRGGAIVTIDLATATVLRRTDVCSVPRGIAYDAAGDTVYVACAGGELVAFAAANGVELRRRMVVNDLRDVVVVPGGLVLSTFRDARILRLEGTSPVAVEEPTVRSATFGRPRVAWRMVSAPPTTPGDAVQMVVAQQKAPDSDDPQVIPPPAPHFYYDSTPTTPEPCTANGPGPVVVDQHDAIHVPAAVLPVDVAVGSGWLVLAAAGNGHTASLPQLVFVSRREPNGLATPFSCRLGGGVVLRNAQITSVAVTGDGKVVALSREPAALIAVDPVTRKEVSRVTLASDTREDTGHAIFHSNSGVGVACASCHPDGRDDGHAWHSQQLGARRTPSLLGTLANTAPYHWNGEAKDMAALVRLTFQSRMRGPQLDDDRIVAMDSWLTGLKSMPATRAPDAGGAIRGKGLFDGVAGCSGCHSGPMRTNNATVDVNTGGMFQVPSLVGVSWRAPHLHDGSAASVKTLLERSHGGATLQPHEILDVDAYVRTF